MFSNCHNCDFYVHKNDETCLNCGTPNPTDYTFWQDFNLFRLATFFSVLMSITLFSMRYTRDIQILQLLFATIIVAFLTLIFEYFISAIYRNNYELGSLNHTNSIISKRLRDIVVRNKKLNQVVEQITDSDTEKLQNVKSKLLSAKEILKNQFYRYHLQQKKIELIRAQNRISPFLFEFTDLNKSQIDNGLISIETYKKDIEGIRVKFTKKVSDEVRSQDLFERDKFLEQLDETETAYSKLRESLIS